MSDDPDAVPELMTNFLHISVPDLTQFQRFVPESCAPGVTGCMTLTDAERDATRKVQVLLTQMAQGITELRDIVAKCAQTYADGAVYTARTIRGAIEDGERKMLPDLAPAFIPQQTKT